MCSPTDAYSFVDAANNIFRPLRLQITGFQMFASAESPLVMTVGGKPCLFPLWSVNGRNASCELQSGVGKNLPLIVQSFNQPSAPLLNAVSFGSPIVTRIIG